MDKQTEQPPKPLTYLCKCGWCGVAEQMTKPDYTCPNCGEFNTVRVMLQLNDNPLRTANLGC